MLAKLSVTAAVTLGFGIAATHAAAASLKVTVGPTKVHPGVHYTVTISGRFNTHARSTPPYLLAFIQYSGQPCRPTATAEYALPGSEWDWDFYPQVSEASSPFKNVAYWTAGSRLGARRVCAYLYAGKVSPASKSKPLARASTTYRNTAAPRRR